MAIPKLNTCCGCAELKTGTLIIGVLGLVVSFLMVIIVYTTDVNPKIFISANLDPPTLRAILAFSCAMSMIISSLLIFGAMNEKPLLLLPWIYLTILGIFLNTLSKLIAVIILLVHGLIGAAVSVFIALLISVPISVYIWLVVYTLYRNLRYDRGSVLDYQNA